MTWSAGSVVETAPPHERLAVGPGQARLPIGKRRTSKCGTDRPNLEKISPSRKALPRNPDPLGQAGQGAQRWTPAGSAEMAQRWGSIESDARRCSQRSSVMRRSLPWHGVLITSGMVSRWSERLAPTPRQSRPGRHGRPPVGGRGLRGQHPRQISVAAHGGRSARCPISSRTPTPQAGETARGQGLRLDHLRREGSG